MTKHDKITNQRRVLKKALNIIGSYTKAKLFYFLLRKEMTASTSTALIDERMVQILGTRPNVFEEEMKQPTGKDLYIKRFVLDVFTTTKTQCHVPGTIEYELFKLTLDDNKIKGRDIALDRWNNLSEKFQNMWERRAKNMWPITLEFNEKSKPTNELVQMPSSLHHANYALVMMINLKRDWKLLGIYMRSLMKQNRKKDCVIIEKMPEPVQVLRMGYFKQKISYLLYVTLFGSDLCLLNKDEIIDREGGIDYIHLTDPERIQKLFTLENHCATVHEKEGFRYELRARVFIRDLLKVYYKGFIEYMDDDFITVRLWDDPRALIVCPNPASENSPPSLYSIKEINPVRIRYNHSRMEMVIISPSMCSTIRECNREYIAEYCL